jgi:hypothetical protein
VLEDQLSWAICTAGVRHRFTKQDRSGTVPPLRRISEVLAEYVGGLLNRRVVWCAKRAEPFQRVRNSGVAHWFEPGIGKPSTTNAA